MSATFGHLEGKLTLTIAGNEISLGYIEIPVTGHLDRGTVQLSAETAQVRDAVQELFRQQKGQVQ